jgi:hypothetical protein
MSKAKNMSKSVDQCNHLFSHFLFKTTKLYMYRTIMLPVVSYGYKTWSLTLREEYRLRMFDGRMLRKTFMSMRKEEETGENCVMKSIAICTANKILLEQSSKCG